MRIIHERPESGVEEFADTRRRRLPPLTIEHLRMAKHARCASCGAGRASTWFSRDGRFFCDTCAGWEKTKRGFRALGIDV
jgi:hypothetical protein